MSTSPATTGTAPQPGATTIAPASPRAQLLYTVAEAADLLRISRATCYLLVMRGELDSIKIGHARRVPRAALDRYIAEALEDAKRRRQEGGGKA